MSECNRAGKLFGGCRFEPRYDLGAPDLSRFKNITGYDLCGVLEAAKPKTYVHDVCVRCGKIVSPEITITNELAPTTPNARDE